VRCNRASTPREAWSLPAISVDESSGAGERTGGDTRRLDKHALNGETPSGAGKSTGPPVMIAFSTIEATPPVTVAWPVSVPSTWSPLASKHKSL
jgi:hypothetical protein